MEEAAQKHCLPQNVPKRQFFQLKRQSGRDLPIFKEHSVYTVAICAFENLPKVI